MPTSVVPLWEHGVGGQYALYDSHTGTNAGTKVRPVRPTLIAAENPRAYGYGMLASQTLAEVTAVAIPSLLPTLAVIISIVRSDSKIDGLRTELNARIDKVDTRLGSIERDMREFYGTQRQHDARLDSLERKRPT
jgi:hypothetical protein